MPTVRILAVDDDPYAHALVESLLEDDRYEVTFASSGEEALRRAREARLDLIILDVLMPEMDGFTLIQTLRSDSTCALVPIIFLTGLEQDADRRRGFQLGADDFISKDQLMELGPEGFVRRVEAALAQSATINSLFDIEAETIIDAVDEVERPILTGNLGQVGLPPLLALLESERRSGVLVVTNQSSGVHGELTLADGQVHDVTIREQPIGGVEAVAQLLCWPTGSYELFNRAGGGEDLIKLSVAELLAAAAELVEKAGLTRPLNRPRRPSS